MRLLSPDRWQIVERVFHEALAVAASERDAFVDSSCASDPEMCREVRTLLAAASDSDSRVSLMSHLAAEWASDRAPATVVGDEVGSYRVLSLLGAGGMGEVYLAEDHSLGRRVALKLLPARFSADPSRLRRFTEEARAASALNHPNIITVYHIGAFEGRRFIATEFIDGETLRERLARGPLPVGDAIDVARQVATALAAAHAAGIVHRDIKPENVMIRRDGYVKVVDFGLAKLAPAETITGVGERHPRASAATVTGAVLGTLQYMAPEQAAGNAVDARADLYSLGVVLHEMLTGGLPATTREGTQQLPASVASIVASALAPDAGARYQRAEELERDLAAVLESLKDRSTQRRHRRRTAALIASVLIALLTIAAWVFFTSRFREARGSLASGELIGIAIMPFEAVGLPAGEEYLGLGITDALATQLGTVPRFGVRPTSSVLGRTKLAGDAVAIGRGLRVDYILTGLIQRYDDRVRVTVHLTDVATGAQRWSDRIDGRFVDLFQLQDAVATRVAASMSTRLSGADRTRLASGQTANPAAYTRYLQARFFLSKAESHDIKRAVDLFQQAIDLDAGYVAARAGLSTAYRMLGLGAVRALPPNEAMPRARQAALAALRLDASSAEAHLTLGLVSFAYDWDWAAAERSLQQSIALNPNNGDARRGYGWFLGAMGRFDEALGELREAVALDPVAILTRENYGVVLGLAGRHEEGLEQLRVASELDPSAPRPHGRRVSILESMGRLDEAIGAWQTSLRLAGNTARADEIGRVLAAGGYRACVEFELRRIQPDVEPLSAANLYASIGDYDKAAAYLEKSLPGKNTWLPFLKVDPTYAPLHGHPVFERVLSQIGL